MLTIFTLLFLTGYFESLPVATLAAIVIAALIALIDLAALRDFYGVYSSRLGRAYGFAARADFIAAIAAMLGVMILGTLAGLFVGVLISLLLLLYRASRAPIAELGRVPGISGHFSDLDRHPENRRVEGITVLRSRAGCSSPTPARSPPTSEARPGAITFTRSSSTPRRCRSSM